MKNDPNRYRRARCVTMRQIQKKGVVAGAWKTETGRSSWRRFLNLRLITATPLNLPVHSTTHREQSCKYVTVFPRNGWFSSEMQIRFKLLESRCSLNFVTPGITMKKKNDFHAVSSVSPWSSLPVLFWIYFEAVLTSFKKFWNLSSTEFASR